MAERIDEAALPMSPPWCLMVPNGVAAPLCARPYRLRDEGIGIVAEHLNPCRRGAQPFRAFPAIPLRLADKESRTRDLKSGDRPTTPQHPRTECTLVPSDGGGSIRDCQHQGDNRPT